MKVRHLSMAFGREILYDDAEFTLGDGDKTGMVGANGAGKTTLLRILLGELQAKLDALGAHEAENALAELTEQMGIGEKLLARRTGELSGGQKYKVAFARLLYAEPDILLLDEPTNHLDAGTRQFVVDFLNNYRGSVLMISHDADFLDAVAKKILFVDKLTHKTMVFEGNYSAFRKRYAQERLLKELRIAAQEREIKKLAEFVQRAKQASRTNHNLKRMGQDREEKLAKARAALKKRDGTYRRVKMKLEPAHRNPAVPLAAEGVRFRYPGKPLLWHDLSFALKGGEKFLVVGENGVGKSTLLKLAVGILRPERGEIRRAQGTDIAYYAQELELLDPEKTVFENTECDGCDDIRRRNILGNFLFREDAVFKKVCVLSSGEKARVALCKLLLQRVNLLVLDEPTNHLDPDTQAVIGENFRDYTGTLLLVSHNPAFAGQIGVDRMLVLPEGNIVDYSEELLHYYSLLNADFLG